MEVINPKVLERRPDDRSEIFVPSVSSTCSLTVNEGNALVQIHDAPTRAKYEPLLMLPIKKLTGLRTLKSISENLEALRDQYVDVLTVVTFVRFRFRNRRQTSVRLADFVCMLPEILTKSARNRCDSTCKNKKRKENFFEKIEVKNLSGIFEFS